MYVCTVWHDILRTRKTVLTLRKCSLTLRKKQNWTDWKCNEKTTSETYQVADKKEGQVFVVHSGSTSVQVDIVCLWQLLSQLNVKTSVVHRQYLRRKLHTVYRRVQGSLCLTRFWWHSGERHLRVCVQNFVAQRLVTELKQRRVSCCCVFGSHRHTSSESITTQLLLRRRLDTYEVHTYMFRPHTKLAYPESMLRIERGTFTHRRELVVFLKQLTFWASWPPKRY